MRYQGISALRHKVRLGTKDLLTDLHISPESSTLLPLIKADARSEASVARAGLLKARARVSRKDFFTPLTYHSTVKSVILM